MLKLKKFVFKKIKDSKMELLLLKNQNGQLQAESKILQQIKFEQLYQTEARRNCLEQ